uniref:Secreted protein n=1 Tax=Strongyloides venezuelensis TaxID=75913 RepID=A0A0K0FIU1_STRVS
MNFLSLAILLGVLIDISYGLSHNCFSTTTITCTVRLMPGEAAYKLFLDSLKNSERSLFDFLLTGETDQNLIDEANKLIKQHVSQDSIKTFFSKLKDVYYKPGSKVEIMPCNDGTSCQFNYANRRY